MFNKSKKLAILLSSYNGEQFIEQQLQSLIDMKADFIFDIHIRDDGSSDKTCETIKKFSQKHANIHLYEENNVGVIASFLWLVEKVSGYDYYAFCDQDDFWQPLKALAAIDKFEKHEEITPLVYCSAYDYVDQNLNFIGRFTSKSNFSPSNLLIENCAPGCTMLFNSALREKYLSISAANISNRVVMHDWLFLLLGLHFGMVIYDRNSYLLYRQHANNVIGKKSGLLPIFRSKYKQFIKECKRPQHLLYLQNELFSDITSGQVNSLTHKLSCSFVSAQRNFYSRAKFAFSGKIKRIRKVDDLIFKILFVFGY
ncbi:glycosyltransferase, partial [Escherichia coli]|nr:glycosyltransferase [Escherichia coli]